MPLIVLKVDSQDFQVYIMDIDKAQETLKNTRKRSKHMLNKKITFEITSKPQNIFEDFNNWSKRWFQ